MLPDTIEAEDHRVEVVVLVVTLWTTEEVAVAAVEDEANMTGGHHHRPTRSCRLVSKRIGRPTTMKK